MCFGLTLINYSLLFIHRLCSREKRREGVHWSSAGAEEEKWPSGGGWRWVHDPSIFFYPLFPFRVSAGLFDASTTFGGINVQKSFREWSYKRRSVFLLKFKINKIECTVSLVLPRDAHFRSGWAAFSILQFSQSHPSCRSTFPDGSPSLGCRDGADEVCLRSPTCADGFVISKLKGRILWWKKWFQLVGEWTVFMFLWGISQRIIMYFLMRICFYPEGLWSLVFVGISCFHSWRRLFCLHLWFPNNSVFIWSFWRVSLKACKSRPFKYVQKSHQ